MNQHKKRIYTAILVVAGLALVVDRLASRPAAAAAATAATPGLLGIDTPKGPLVSVAVPPFPRDLPTPAAGEVRDVFAPSEAARFGLFGAASGDGAVGRSTRGRIGARHVSTPRSFEQDHKLTAVMLGEQVTFAVVGDRWIRVGDKIDDCELIEVTGTAATFRCPDGNAVLSVSATESGSANKSQ